MKRETLIWTLLFLFGAIGLVTRGIVTGAGSSYVRPVEVRAKGETTGQEIVWTKYVKATHHERNAVGVVRSWPRTLGMWLAALLTISALSFLYGDNVFLKFTQALIVGVSAGYTVVLAFWTVFVPDLMGNLLPELTRATMLPGMEAKESNWIYLIPLVFSVMLLWRLMPVGGWISRWPLAFFIGVTAGTKLLGYFKADFVDQVNNAIVPLIVIANEKVDYGASLKNLVAFLSVLAALVYFFFSLEHRGALGKVARTGICVLMITFGAMFASTVMTRITVMSNQMEFLFDEWLWLVKPPG